MNYAVICLPLLSGCSEITGKANISSDNRVWMERFSGSFTSAVFGDRIMLYRCADDAYIRSFDSEEEARLWCTASGMELESNEIRVLDVTKLCGNPNFQANRVIF